MGRLASLIVSGFALALLVGYGYRVLEAREPALPTVAEPPSLIGVNCPDALNRARDSRQRAPQQAKNEYLWLVSRCPADDLLSQALLELGALLAYQPERPALAKPVFKTFLRRFPDHPSGDLALRNLAQLELDDSNYAEAIAHLKRLATQYPNSAYKESAQFLLERTAASLTAQSRSRRAPLEYVELLIPDNPATALVVAVTVIPLVISTFMTWRKEPTRLNSVLFAVMIACALLVGFFNYLKSSREEARLSADIAALTRW